MRPSKTQAQKAAEKAEKQAERERERDEEKAARAALMRSQGESQSQSLTQANSCTSKADKRAAKKAKKALLKSNAATKIAPILPSAHSIAHASECNDQSTEALNTDSEKEEEALESSKKQRLEQLSELEVATVAATSSSSKDARVVFNHSSYIEGLQPFIAKLKKQPGILTIHPGKITGGNSHCEEFTVKYQREAADGAYYYVAAKGSQRQDLRITPIQSVAQAAMQAEEFINEAIKQVLQSSHESSESHSSESLKVEPNLNREVAYFAAQAHRTKGAARAAELKEKEKQRQHEQEVAKKIKKLKPQLGNNNELVNAYAEKWVEWEK